MPSMEELGKMLNENGECIVENFTVGRKGKAIACIFCISNSAIIKHDMRANLLGM